MRRLGAKTMVVIELVYLVHEKLYRIVVMSAINIQDKCLNLAILYILAKQCIKMLSKGLKNDRKLCVL